MEAPVEELPAEAREEVLPPAGGETILVVEDEETIRILIQRVLETQGYQVFCASNADEAEQNARQVGEIDLLLTDIVMPGDSGPKLYQRLAAKHPLLKALFISGYTDQGILQNDLLEPNMPFLQKPFAPSKLSQKVRQVLDTREMPGG